MSCISINNTKQNFFWQNICVNKKMSININPKASCFLVNVLETFFQIVCQALDSLWVYLIWFILVQTNIMFYWCLNLGHLWSPSIQDKPIHLSGRKHICLSLSEKRDVDVEHLAPKVKKNCHVNVGQEPWSVLFWRTAPGLMLQGGQF